MYAGHADPDLLVGLSGPDDAAVYRLNAEEAIVLTADFFPPVVDDPYTYGAIAAANAMSDVYAMGGEVVLALNLIAYPDDLPADAVSEILRGAAEKMREGGGVVAGGHSLNDSEPKFGLCVMGRVHPDRVVLKGGALPGDLLYLTKPLGTGLVLSAAKMGRAGPGELEASLASMLALNRHASRQAVRAGVRAMTDVTGFGLLGHALEMASAGGVLFEFEADRVPLLAGARFHAEAGIVTGTGSQNMAHLHEHLAPGSVEPEPGAFALLCDPQTSGGLLLALPPDRVLELEAAFAAAGLPLWRIGSVHEGTGIRVR